MVISISIWKQSSSVVQYRLFEIVKILILFTISQNYGCSLWHPLREHPESTIVKLTWGSLGSLISQVNFIPKEQTQSEPSNWSLALDIMWESNKPSQFFKSSSDVSVPPFNARPLNGMEVPNHKARQNNLKFKFYYITTDFHTTSLIRCGRLSKSRQSRIPEHKWRCASREGRRAMTTGKGCVAYVKKEAGLTLTSELLKPSAVYSVSLMHRPWPPLTASVYTNTFCSL